jgi:HNH endonuclease
MERSQIRSSASSKRANQGKCQWRSEDGGICGSTYRVEFHHKQDRAKGGAGTPENVIQLCEKHHLLATEIAWGEKYIEQFRRRPREQAPEELQSRLDFHDSQ